MNSPVLIRVRRVDRVDEILLEQLTDILVDCVAGGASVSFMSPFSREAARTFWTKIAQSVTNGERALLVAEDDKGPCGTVQLILDLPPNQPHRADVAKMLVHRRARRRGVGAALLEAVDHTARACGRNLLVLDTVTGSDADRLYTRAGWSRVGDIPRYALMPDGPECSTTYFYKNLKP